MERSAGYSASCACSVSIAFSFVFCISCRKSGAFAPKKCNRSNRRVLAPPVCDQNKSHSFRNGFCFGGDKRDRTADLMTASCYRFVVLSVFASNTSIQSAKSTGFFENLPAASTRFYAHLGHNLGQGSRADLERFCRSGRGLWLACCR